MIVVVPGYRLVWYNLFFSGYSVSALLFPVIAWYGIILPQTPHSPCGLLFPVIAWYGIILIHLSR